MDPELKAIPAVLDALGDLDQEAQRRIVDYVRSRLRLGASYPDFPSTDGEIGEGLPVGSSLGGSIGELLPFGGSHEISPLDIFSMIGMALSAVGGAKFIFDGIKLWMDRKKGRKLKLAKGDFQLEIEGDVSTAEIERGFEQFKRLRQEVEGDEQVLVVESSSKTPEPTAKQTPKKKTKRGKKGSWHEWHCRVRKFCQVQSLRSSALRTCLGFCMSL
jgi:hypothetical protein